MARRRRCRWWRACRAWPRASRPSWSSPPVGNEPQPRRAVLVFRLWDSLLCRGRIALGCDIRSLVAYSLYVRGSMRTRCKNWTDKALNNGLKHCHRCERTRSQVGPSTSHLNLIVVIFVAIYLTCTSTCYCHVWNYQLHISALMCVLHIYTPYDIMISLVGATEQRFSFICYKRVNVMRYAAASGSTQYQVWMVIGLQSRSSKCNRAVHVYTLMRPPTR